MSNTVSTGSPVEQAVRQYLTANCQVVFAAPVTDNTDLFKEGLIDSYAFMELIKYLEKDFKIRFTDEELVSSLNTFNSIVSTVQARLASS